MFKQIFINKLFMKRIIILTLIISLGLLSNPVQANSGYYDNMTVTITSNPPTGTNGVINAKVGDTIEFTRHTSVEVGIGSTHWLYSPFVLDCDSSDPTVKCKVIGKGDSKMEFSMNIMTDWTPEKSTYQTFSANNIINIHVTDNSGVSSANATVKTTARAIAKPDLTILVDKAKLVNRKQKDGTMKEQYKIGVTIKNIDSGNAVGKIYYSTLGTSASQPILISSLGLKAGKSKKVFYYLDATEKGNIYTFKADPDNKIVEFDETNNSYSMTIGE